MLPKRFLYNFCFQCHRVNELPKSGVPTLDTTFRLPFLQQLEAANPDVPKSTIDFRIAWHEKGLALSLEVLGKTTPVWCRHSQPEVSDGLQLCIDTRDVRNVHRATRYCHRIILLPGDAKMKEERAGAVWLPIHRAKDHPNSVAVERIITKCEFADDGYKLESVIPADILTGYEPSEYNRLGFHYVIADRELGSKYLTSQPPLPHDCDPSMWATLELL